MGRLIDADKLWKDTTSNIDYCEEFLEIIEKQETVDAIPLTYITSRISRLRQYKTYAGDFAADLLEAIIKDYNKEKDNGKTE